MQNGQACISVETLCCTRVERSRRGGRETLGRPKRKACLGWRAAEAPEGLVSAEVGQPRGSEPRRCGMGPGPSAAAPQLCDTDNLPAPTRQCPCLGCEKKRQALSSEGHVATRGLPSRQVAGLVVTGMSPPVPAKGSLLGVGEVFTAHFKVGSPPGSGEPLSPTLTRQHNFTSACNGPVRAGSHYTHFTEG